MPQKIAKAALKFRGKARKNNQISTKATAKYRKGTKPSIEKEPR